MTEFAPQPLPPALPLGEVQTQYLARIAHALDRIADSLEGRSRPAATETGPSKAAPTKVSERRQRAREFVEDLLHYQGPQPWSEIVRRGAYYGHSEKTMERERGHVAISKKVDGRWVWQLKGNIGMEETSGRTEPMGGR